MRLPDENLVDCVARIFGITVLQNLPPDWQTQGWYRAPSVHKVACHPQRRQICLEPVRGKGYQEDPLTWTPTGFHELMHCILQPPRIHLDKVDEFLWLIQYEALVAQALASPKELTPILRWQLSLSPNVLLESYPENFPPLREVPNYQELPFYQQGLAELEILGALHLGQPTWEYPDWSRLDYKAILRGPRNETT